MDFNHLLEREQVERMRADRAACAEARAAHNGLADAYRALVETQRARRVADSRLRPQLRRA